LVEQSESIEATADALIIVEVQVAFVTGIEAVPDHAGLLTAIEALIALARSEKVPVTAYSFSSGSKRIRIAAAARSLGLGLDVSG
jgi:nicotinamidase-related amidase